MTNTKNNEIDHLLVAFFTAKILNCFQMSRELTLARVLQCANNSNIYNKDDIEINKITGGYSVLSILNELESQFLELINQYPEKITQEIVEDYKNFYNAWVNWRFQ